LTWFPLWFLIRHWSRSFPYRFCPVEFRRVDQVRAPNPFGPQPALVDQRQDVLAGDAEPSGGLRGGQVVVDGGHESSPKGNFELRQGFAMSSIPFQRTRFKPGE